ncbi:MAG TPA: threonine synthase [Planctomycetes bacterium]|nr:threonine synthase [Planctomycetota bacterium]HIK60267.1 threonine synthase [Planctomycetota bacterium]
MPRLIDPDTGLSPTEVTLDYGAHSHALLDVEHDFPQGLTRQSFDPSSDQPSGVWRFAQLVDPELDPDQIVTLAEGNTPLYRSESLCAASLLPGLRIKHEGHNPTGSFKDRGMTVAVSRAIAGGAKALACASTGNTAASLAAYAAHAGYPAIVLLPEASTASSKLAQAIAYGARVLRVRGDFDCAMKIVAELAFRGDVALLNSANPFRIEGQKTIVFEMLQQLNWQAPDWIVFPAGNLGNCTAFGKALREALALGLIDSVPRLAAVQAEGAAPFAASFARGFDRLDTVHAETLATAIKIGAPVSFSRAVRSIRETRGEVLAVSDEEILVAKAEVDRAGLGAEPASCAAFAGAKKLALRGIIDPEETVVCVLTGHILKDPDTTLAYHEGRLGEASHANQSRIVEPDLSEIQRAVAEWDAPGRGNA